MTKFMDKFYRQEAVACTRIALFQGRHGADEQTVRSWAAMGARHAFRVVALRSSDQGAAGARAAIRALAVSAK